MSKVWDERYAPEKYYYGTEPNDFLAIQSKIFLKPVSNILCLAEGEGRNSVYLARLGHKVTAVDFSSVALEKLKKLALQANVEVNTICADLSNFQIVQGHWDAIVSIWCHIPSHARRAIHNQVILGLKTGGIYLLESYTPKQIPLGTGGPKDADLLPTANLLKKELPLLRIEYLAELQREIHEGQGHNGMSEVVQLIAIKE